MEGRSPEVPVPIPETTDAGFSEKRAARILEGAQQDDSQVRKTTPLGRQGKTTSLPTSIRSRVQLRSAVLSRKEKILSVYRQNSARIIKLVQSIDELNGQNVRLEEGILDEIKKRRHLQEELLNALLLEQKNILTQEAISKEAWDLIK